MATREQTVAPLGSRYATLSALSYPSFRLYWLALVSSILARNLQIVAQSWLVLQLTDSPLMLGLAGFIYGAPTIPLTLIGGAIADRANRRLLFIFTEAMMAVFYFAIATLIMAGRIQIWHVFVFAFLSGCVRAVDQPTRQALLPSTVPPEAMTNAVALTSMVWQLCRLVGPALAGMLIYLFGVASAFYTGGLAFLIAIALLLALRIRQAAFRAGGGSLLRSTLDGLKFIWHNEIFLILIGVSFFHAIFGMSYVTLMPVYARDILHAGSRGYGFLQSASGAGALIGAIMVALSASSPRKGLLALGALMVFGVILMGFAFATWFPLSLGLVFFIGMANDFFLTMVSSILQLRLPDGLRGRVMGVYGLTWSFMPIGGAIAGTIAEYASASLAVAVGALFVFAVSLFVAVYFRIRE
jgi:MFS family permease